MVANFQLEQSTNSVKCLDQPTESLSSLGLASCICSEVQCSAIWHSPFEQKSKGSELPDKGSWRKEWRSFLPGFQKGSIGCNSCQWLRTKSYCCCSSTNHHLQRMRNKIPITNRKATRRTMNMANWCVAYWLSYWILEHELQCSVAITVTCVLESI